jgi:hypothetical protein
VNLEDGVSDTTRPRLAAQGADLTLVDHLDDAAGESLVLPGDLQRLRAAVLDRRYRLVVLDPIAACLSPKITFALDASIRSAIMPVASLAATTGAAFLLVHQLNGRLNASAYRRMLGGTALANIARAVFAVGIHPATTQCSSFSMSLRMASWIPASLRLALAPAGSPCGRTIVRVALSVWSLSVMDADGHRASQAGEPSSLADAQGEPTASTEHEPQIVNMSTEASGLAHGAISAHNVPEPAQGDASVRFSLLELDLHVLPDFEDWFIDAIKRRDVEAWKMAQGEKVRRCQFSPVTVNGWLRVLLSTLRSAVADLELEHDPTVA